MQKPSLQVENSLSEAVPRHRELCAILQPKDFGDAGYGFPRPGAGFVPRRQASRFRAIVVHRLCFAPDVSEPFHITTPALGWHDDGRAALSGLGKGETFAGCVRFEWISTATAAASTYASRRAVPSS